ncbi:hypothetical protein A1O7_01174 [Cladophialophora yegresii CBS 114405]|uniref:2'-5' RNA ligase family protein n=1 Tax=Cladophialophora yegresii CBS 114405 TaxID=1182544 RepID=W9WJS3_9EURO|nr:uncharacterized protein A1O7_01174 [Cladophialophora yegresii CBS 114405]EXJ64836.1 hypothetical protein A1O7_01174 [Cladophialophora yegresii CBS 114405]
MSTIPHAPYGSSAPAYQRRNEHKAHTGNEHEESYVLTLHTNVEHHKLMTSLREQYFPPALNKLEAHIAVFRALPGSQLSRIIQDIASVAGSQRPFSITADAPFRMRRGVGIRVVDESGQAKGIHQELKARWSPFLSHQDRSFQAHYTVQNKVDDEAVVNDTLEELGNHFHGSQGTVIGLALYRYDRGFWRKERDFTFEDGGP